MAVSFFIVSKKAQGSAPLYFRKHVRETGKFIWISTQVSVDIGEWNKADTPKKKENYPKKGG